MGEIGKVGGEKVALTGLLDEFDALRIRLMQDYPAMEAESPRQSAARHEAYRAMERRRTLWTDVFGYTKTSSGSANSNYEYSLSAEINIDDVRGTATGSVMFDSVGNILNPNDNFMLFLADPLSSGMQSPNQLFGDLQKGDYSRLIELFDSYLSDQVGIGGCTIYAQYELGCAEVYDESTGAYGASETVPPHSIIISIIP